MPLSRAQKVAPEAEAEGEDNALAAEEEAQVRHAIPHAVADGFPF